MPVQQPEYASLRSGLVFAWQGDRVSTAPVDEARRSRATWNGTNPTFQNGGVTFDAVGNYIGVTERTGLSGNVPMTMSAWVRPTAFPGGIARFAGVSAGIRIFPDGRISIFGDSATIIDPVSNATAVLNTWQHVAWTYPGTKYEDVTFFNAGVGPIAVVRSNGTANTGMSWVSGGASHIGMNNFTVYFPGQIADVRIYSRVLTPAEIRLLASRRGIGLAPTRVRPPIKPVTTVSFSQSASSRRMSNTTSSLRQGLVGAWCPSLGSSGPLLIDRSPLSNHASFSGTAYAWRRDLTISGSAFATGSYRPRLDFDRSNSFSVSAWVKTTSTNEQTIVTNSPNGGSTGWEFQIGPTGNVRFLLGNLYSTNYLRSSTANGTISTGTTYHICATYPGTSLASDVRFYINGIPYSCSVNIDTLTSSTVTGAAVRFFSRTNAGYQWTGDLDDIRVYDRVLTASEVRLLSSRRGIGLADTQVRRPTTQVKPRVTTVAASSRRMAETSSLRQGLVGAWCPSLGASGYTLPDRSGRNNHGTLTNMGGQVNWVANGGGLAIQMDGVDDWVSVGNCAMPSGGAPRTVTCWVYKTDDLKYCIPIEVGPFTAMNRWMLAVMGAGGYSGFTNRQVAVEFYTATSGTTTSIPLNTWTHVAATSYATAGSVQIYFNGIAQPMNYKTTAANVINTTPASLGLFSRQYAGGNDFGNGLFDDLRIYNRVLTDAEIRLLASRRGIGLTDAQARRPAVDSASTMYTKVNGAWVPTVPYTKANGVWGPATPQSRVSSAWTNQEYHQEALSWQARAKSAGGSVSASTMAAVSDFCKAIDAAGIRSAMYRLNLFCGTDLASCLTPLYLSPSFGTTVLGNLADANFNFVPTDFVETGSGGGLKGNGTSKFLNTGFASNSLPNGTSLHLSLSATGMETSGDRAAIGSYDSTAPGLFVIDAFTAYVSSRAFRAGTYTDGGFPRYTSPGATESHMIGSKTAANATAIYRAGTLAISNGTSLTLTRTALAQYVYSMNINGAATYYTASTLRMYSIGTGLNSTQAAAFSAAVIAFNAALGRG